jgi:hypothetical protein
MKFHCVGNGDKNNPYCSSEMYLISYHKAVHFLTSLGDNKQLLFAEDLPCWIVWAADVRYGGRFTSQNMLHAKYIHTGNRINQTMTCSRPTPWSDL